MNATHTPLKIEAGKYYRTRGEQIVGPMRRRAVPEHEVPNMVRSIIVAYLTHVALHGVKP
jgi:hypothetical protein